MTTRFMSAALVAFCALALSAPPTEAFQLPGSGQATYTRTFNVRNAKQVTFWLRYATWQAVQCAPVVTVRSPGYRVFRHYAPVTTSELPGEHRFFIRYRNGRVTGTIRVTVQQPGCSSGLTVQVLP